ncbi:universal stress protein [Echinicola jeungdonensis]|uniref:universal stress protein n=1 Tax=Echinicola jeungdonensis TaxID=709343 RepID=UPI0025B4F563|nr:universal stress protein [Echinicola jeungdonensis]MDN3671271.1 universal stress protein [Echinicola jeungdonensis]
MDIHCINVVETDLDWKHLTEKEKANHPDIQDLEDEANRKLNEFVDSHKAKYMDMIAVVRTGVVAEEIVHYSDEIAADLVVVGAYGKGYEEGKFIGSDFQKVLRKASGPVLAIKKAFEDSEFMEMVFASRFDDDSWPVFLKMRPLIKALDAKVHFLYVNTPDHFTPEDEAEKQMGKFAEGQDDIKIEKHIHDFAEVEKGIIDFSENKNIGIIGLPPITGKKPGVIKLE